MDSSFENGLHMQKLIKWLSYGKKIHISIHYLSSTLQEDNMLGVLPHNKVHYCSFCNAAKTTSKGLSLCMKNKRMSINKAISSKSLYIGKCYLGITEIIKPVFRGNQPFCIIYIGNMITNELYDSRLTHFEKISRITHVSPKSLIFVLDTVEKVDNSTLEEYKEIATIISSSIELYLNGLPSIKLKQLNNTSVDKMHWIVRQTIDYINQFYYTDIKLSQIADLYFINEQYLCRLFSMQTGSNFSNYVNTVRIDNAKSLLCSSPKKIIEISEEVGFNNITYFNKIFKKYTYCTPKEYRNIYR